jgi:hypothetical protein
MQNLSKMKKIENVGKSLTKEEMKKLKGGGTHCNTQADCSCGQAPFPEHGQVCNINVHECQNIPFCP